MATEVGRTDPSVAESLLSCPWDFEFFQAVRLLATLRPERPLLAGFGKPPEELVRFHANPSLTFPASAIQDITNADAEGTKHVTVNFLGLTGPQGTLPEHYTEYLLARVSAHDKTATAFFDLFNHRLISLFYLAWEKHHFPVEHERSSHAEGSSGHVARYLFDLIGLGTAGLRGRLSIRDEALIFYGGLIAQRPHSAVALAGILRDYFQVPVEVEQFVGQWCTVENENLAFLSGSTVYNQLGAGAVAGDRVWNQQARFRIRLGPLDWGAYDRFLPGGDAFRRLVDVVRYFTDETRDFEVQLELLADEVPGIELGDAPGSSRLGYSSWLKTAIFEVDARDLVLPVRSPLGHEKESN